MNLFQWIAFRWKCHDLGVCPKCGSYVSFIVCQGGSVNWCNECEKDKEHRRDIERNLLMEKIRGKKKEGNSV
jgi:hypothetical protein